ncbi:MAG: hypothetical protein U0932_14585 [Thiobacillus sp.]|nr:hypothetical protein [Thiobacillus sp.]
MINFGSGKLIAVPTNLADGTAIANPTPVILGTMQDVSLDLSTEIKTLYGSKRYPIAVGQGKGKTEIKAKYAEIDGAIMGSLFFGKASTAGIKAAMFDFAATIPATPFAITIAPPSSGTFVADLGVLDATTGVQLTRVASAPAAGQYSLVVATGIYTFASADTGKAIKISYEYSASAGGQIYTMTNETMGYTPSFTLLLQNGYDGKTMVCKLNRCVSGKLSVPLKSDDFAIYDFEAEAFAAANGELGYICLF